MHKFIYSHAIQYLFFITLNMTSISVSADPVELKLSNGLIANAEYSQGHTEKPAVLLVHGFLTTHQQTTIARLTATLKDAEYTVLAPTLSLGINRRNSSLPCEAIHTHTMENDVDELHQWMKWLKGKGQKHTVMLGHSYGSLHILVYLNTGNPLYPISAIATSLVDIEHAIGKQRIDDQIKQARLRLNEDNHSLHNYRISYCNNYTASPLSFISYAHWNKENILGLLKKTQTPLTIIMGSNDQRMDADWPDSLKASGVNLAFIDGAEHFFSGEYEFDLYDKVLDLLEDIKQP